MLERFSVSLDKHLLAEYDHLLNEQGYSNRSEAIRDLIRHALIKQEWEAGEEVVGVVTMVYDHHQRQLQDQITEIQHDYHHHVISTTHVHLDHDNCLEVIIVRGDADQVKELAQRLSSVRGVKAADLTASTTGKRIG
jgi:CopG family nickel-responsive transcriptional regulator